MLEKLSENWRARRVLLLGGASGLTPWMQQLLEALGARPARIPPSSGAETLCRAMSAGRISAVIVPQLGQLAEGRAMDVRLHALMTLLTEIREAGVPLTILCSDENVYRARQRPWYAREEDAIGGETPEGLTQSLLQLFAEGASRGLAGDAVRVRIVRHMPCLGCSEATVQYTQWCRALLAGDLVHVRHPAAQGIFLHPLDICLGTLALGARFFSGEAEEESIFNLGAGPQSLCANRSAALRLIARAGGTRPISECEPPAAPAVPLLDGARARLLCGCRCLFTADEALDALLAFTRAAAKGPGHEAGELRAQTEACLRRLG